jgi:hypothetical protein
MPCATRSHRGRVGSGTSPSSRWPFHQHEERQEGDDNHARDRPEQTEDDAETGARDSARALRSSAGDRAGKGFEDVEPAFEPTYHTVPTAQRGDELRKSVHEVRDLGDQRRNQEQPERRDDAHREHEYDRCRQPAPQSP